MTGLRAACEHAASVIIALILFARRRKIRFLALCDIVTAAVPIGLFSAMRRNTLVDHVAMGLALIGQSAPTFFLGILFSVGVVIVAALNLVLDFDFIEQGVERGVLRDRCVAGWGERDSLRRGERVLIGDLHQEHREPGIVAVVDEIIDRRRLLRLDQRLVNTAAGGERHHADGRLDRDRGLAAGTV